LTIHTKQRIDIDKLSKFIARLMMRKYTGKVEINMRNGNIGEKQPITLVEKADLT